MLHITNFNENRLINWTIYKLHGLYIISTVLLTIYNIHATCPFTGNAKIKNSLAQRNKFKLGYVCFIFKWCYYYKYTYNNNYLIIDI